MKLLVEGASRLSINLDKGQIERFQLYYDELIAWNENVNLTAVTGYEEVQARHFLDSLIVGFALPTKVMDGRGKVLDVGTGAGFPGLPLKIAYPELDLTLLDATAKKTAFLSNVIETLVLDNVNVVTGRAEDEAHSVKKRERFDVVISRAVARLNVLAELCLPFCKVEGLMIAQKGRGVDMEIEEAHTAIDTLGGRVKDSSEADGHTTGDGSLVVIMKERPTPSNYPRRAGMPAKRPLLGPGLSR